MINQNYICVIDLETGGLDINSTEPLEVAAKVFNPRTLEPCEGGVFHSFMGVQNLDLVEDGALRVNKIKREDIPNFPNPKVVWNAFVDFINKYNPKGTKMMAPIAAGKNVEAFDLPIMERMNEMYCKKGRDTLLFNKVRVLNIEDIIWPWFENDPGLKDMKMDTLRDYLGLSHEGSHGALVDVEQEAAIIMRFLRYYRLLAAKNNEKFKGSFKK